MRGKVYKEKMEGLFPLSRMAAGGRIFGEEGNVIPTTSSRVTGVEMIPFGIKVFVKTKITAR
jgi:hypothetical protein